MQTQNESKLLQILFINFHELLKKNSLITLSKHIQVVLRGKLNSPTLIIGVCSDKLEK